MDIDEELRRGELAEMLRENPAFISAVEDVQKDVLTRWMATTEQQTEEREHLYRLSQAVKEVVQQINQYVLNKDILITKEDSEDVLELSEAEKEFDATDY